MQPAVAGKINRKLILAVIVVAVLVVGVGYASIRIYSIFHNINASTNLTISSTPNPTTAESNVDIRGRLTNSVGAGLVGYNVTVESSSDEILWSELAGPFLTQNSSGSGQQAGIWYVQGGWNI